MFLIVIGGLTLLTAIGNQKDAREKLDKLNYEKYYLNNELDELKLKPYVQ